MCFLMKSDDEDDYENPDSNDDGEASGGDYESPVEGSDSDNSYEAPPSEPSEDKAQICPAKPMDNCDYIGTHKWTVFSLVVIWVYWNSHDGTPLFYQIITGHV